MTSSNVVSLTEALANEADLADLNPDVKVQYLKNNLNSLQNRLLETLTTKVLTQFSADGTQSQRDDQVALFEAQAQSLRNGLAQVRAALEAATAAVPPTE